LVKRLALIGEILHEGASIRHLLISHGVNAYISTKRFNAWFYKFFDMEFTDDE
jgi:hypothetical protein